MSPEERLYLCVWDVFPVLVHRCSSNETHHPNMHSQSPMADGIQISHLTQSRDSPALLFRACISVHYKSHMAVLVS